MAPAVLPEQAGAGWSLWQSAPAGMGNLCSFGWCWDTYALELPAGKSVMSMSDIEAELLVDGKLRLKLEVSAWSAV